MQTCFPLLLMWIFMHFSTWFSLSLSVLLSYMFFSTEFLFLCSNAMIFLLCVFLWLCGTESSFFFLSCTSLSSLSFSFSLHSSKLRATSVPQKHFPFILQTLPPHWSLGLMLHIIIIISDLLLLKGWFCLLFTTAKTRFSSHNFCFGTLSEKYPLNPSDLPHSPTHITCIEYWAQRKHCNMQVGVRSGRVWAKVTPRR